MNEDYSKAISFANNYCALADGLVNGLEDFLAENVVLDWFGKTIRGRNNVAAFLSTHKVNSRHVFNEINPTDHIGYNKKPNRRRRKPKSEYAGNVATNGNLSIKKNLWVENTPINQAISPKERSCSSSKSSVLSEDENNLTLELNDDDVSNLFKLENIRSTDVEEIEQRINEISLENEGNVRNQGVNLKGIDNIEGNILESSMKYVEAHGEILFSKKSRRLNNRNECRFSNSTQTWRKPCKLQIAYSSEKVCLPANNNNVGIENSSQSNEPQGKLLSLNQITELSNHLVPITEDFQFRNINETNKLDLVSRFLDDQSLLQNINYNDWHNSHGKFTFNHVIHVIIYEGRSRCRMNLSQKFA